MSGVKTYAWISTGFAMMFMYMWGWVWLYLPELPVHGAFSSAPVAYCAACGVACALPFFVYTASLETSQPLKGMVAPLWKIYGVVFLVLAQLGNWRFSDNEAIVSYVFTMLYDRPAVALLCFAQTVPFGVAAWCVFGDRHKAVLIAAALTGFATLLGLMAQTPVFDLYRMVYNVAGAAAGAWLAWSYAQGTCRCVRCALVGVDACLAALLAKEILFILAV